MIPWRFCWNNIRLRPTRTVLTILSIAGGVAAVVAVLQSTAATRQELDSLHQTLASRVAMEIVASDASAFSLADLPPVAEQPGVQLAMPIFRVYAKIVAGREEARGIAIGIAPEHYREIRDFAISSGRMYSAPGEVCLEASVADRLRVSPGDTIRLGARGLPWLLSKTVVGILQPLGIGAVEETASVFMPLSDAARLGKSPRKATALQIVLEPNVQADRVTAALRSQLSDPLVVARSASAAELSRPTEAMINISLNVAAALSVVAAIFIVINTFQISVAERQRQFALLRIVGATVEQVRATMYREAFFLAVIGTGLGILMGIAGSSALAQGMQEVFGFETLSPVPMQFHAILAGLIFGPLVTLVSVWHPARTACDAEPLMVLKSGAAPRQGHGLRSSLWMAVAAVLVSASMFVCVHFEILSQWTSIAGIGAAQIAGLLFLPALIGPGSSLLYGIIRRFFRVESQLGQRQLLDNFGRTSLTAAVLFIVSATSISVGTTTLTVTEDVQSWLNRTLTTDFLLRASQPRVDMSESKVVSEEVESHLTNIPGIIFVDRVSFAMASINGTPATLMVRQFSGYETLPLDLLTGNASEVREQLETGEAVIGSVLAHRLSISPGDSVRIEISGISHSIRVSAIVKEYTAGGLMVIMDRDAAQRMFPIQQAQVYGIRCDPSATEEVGRRLREVCREHALIFQSLSDLRDLVRRMIAGLSNRLWLILILALVIAGFAIVNTLTMNVIEQTRQLGMLRVVGMTRMQVFRLFQFQAFVLSLLALLPGALVGVLLALLISKSFQGVTELGVVFSVNSVLLGSYLICGILLSLLAAAIPAIRAGRLKPLEAIHEE